MVVTHNFERLFKCTAGPCFSCKSGPFHNLTGLELFLMNRNVVQAVFKKGELIFKQGTESSHIAYIRKGLVKICLNENDQEMLLSVEKRGNWIGLQALNPTTHYPYSASACEDVELCLFNTGSINAFIQNNASFGSALMKLLNESAVLNYKRMASLCLKQVHGKFADLMLFLSLSIYKKTAFTTSLSKKDMASLTNMSPESFSRVLKDFIKDKIISYEGDQVKILDYDKMRKISFSG